MKKCLTCATWISIHLRCASAIAKTLSAAVPFYKLCLEKAKMTENDSKFNSASRKDMQKHMHFLDWDRYVCYKPNEQYAGYMIFWFQLPLCVLRRCNMHGRYTLFFGIHVTCTFVYALSHLWYALTCICSCAYISFHNSLKQLGLQRINVGHQAWMAQTCLFQRSRWFFFWFCLCFHSHIFIRRHSY